jgi:hypothetical protein
LVFSAPVRIGWLRSRVPVQIVLQTTNDAVIYHGSASFL